MRNFEIVAQTPTPAASGQLHANMTNLILGIHLQVGRRFISNLWPQARMVKR